MCSSAPEVRSGLPAHNRYQRRYFSRPERKSRMAPSGSRYVLRHLEELLTQLALPPGSRLLELGCGMGRFTLHLAGRGYETTGVDLSADLLAVLRRHDPEGRIKVVCADAARTHEHLRGPFDAAVGFFFLHHLRSLEGVFRSVGRILKPGSQVAFCEPNAFNPLFYLQILLTPGMTFRGDGGVARMRPRLVSGALRRSGFGGARYRRYGLFPPLVANTSLGATVERRLERLRPLRPFLAFQVFQATHDG